MVRQHSRKRFNQLSDALVGKQETVRGHDFGAGWESKPSPRPCRLLRTPVEDAMRKERDVFDEPEPLEAVQVSDPVHEEAIHTREGAPDVSERVLAYVCRRMERHDGPYTGVGEPVEQAGEAAQLEE